MFDTRPEGFEPPTSWSVARHSIQLSYGRKQTAMKFARGTLQNHNANTPADHSFSRGEFCVGVGGQGDPTEAYIRTPRGGIDRSPDAALRKIRPRKVPTTGLEPVRRFRHWSLKPACLPIPARGLYVLSCIHTRTDARRGTRTLTRLTPTGS